MRDKRGNLRKLRRPPEDLAERNIPRQLQPAKKWYRLHLGDTSAVMFSVNPQHRFSHPECAHPVLYLGMDARTCLWERFGDLMYDGRHVLPRQLWAKTVLTEISVPGLRTCDLTKERTRSAMTVDMTALTSHELSVPQAWGLAIQRHPAGFQAIKYASRFNDRACLALFGTGNLPEQLKEKRVGPLTEIDEAEDWLEEHKVCLV